MPSNLEGCEEQLSGIQGRAPSLRSDPWSGLLSEGRHPPFLGYVTCIQCKTRSGWKICPVGKKQEKCEPVFDILT